MAPGSEDPALRLQVERMLDAYDGASNLNSFGANFT